MTGPADKPARQLITDALVEARQLRAPVDTAGTAADRAVAALEAALEGTIQQAVSALPEPAAPPCSHRSAHRPGARPKIESAPELRAFIAARIDRMTFDQVAAEVAAHFPEDRRVRKSAIHAWWQSNRPA
jgi:hypothetical protein